MDTNFIMVLIGVFFIMIIIKSMMNFKQEEDEKEELRAKEKFDIPNPSIKKKSTLALQKSDHSRGKVIDLNERRRLVAYKKSKGYTKSISIKTEVTKMSPSKKEWWS